MKNSFLKATLKKFAQSTRNLNFTIDGYPRYHNTVLIIIMFFYLYQHAYIEHHSTLIFYNMFYNVNSLCLGQAGWYSWTFQLRKNGTDQSSNGPGA